MKTRSSRTKSGVTFASSITEKTELTTTSAPSALSIRHQCYQHYTSITDTTSTTNTITDVELLLFGTAMFFKLVLDGVLFL